MLLAACRHDFGFLERADVADVVDVADVADVAAPPDVTGVPDAAADLDAAVDRPGADVPLDVAPDVADVPDVMDAPDAACVTDGGAPGPRSLVAGTAHNCVARGGAWWCWGWNVGGQLGNGATEDRWTPAAVSFSGMMGSPIERVALGAAHSCALLRNGRVWCWGSNCRGSLGVMSSGRCAVTSDVCTPPAGAGPEAACDRNPVEVASLGADAADLALGRNHSCALLRSGRVRCWGAGHAGQLGAGVTTDQREPRDVLAAPSGAPLEGVVELRAGGDFTCARRCDGGVWCWGDDTVGQLGVGGGAAQTRATRVPGLAGVTALALGAYNACAILADRTARCWGWNDFGVVGTGAAGGNVATPRAVAGLRDVTSLAVGHYHACAIAAGASLTCWGFNRRGMLGDGTFTDRPAPGPPVALPAVREVAAGAEHTCAVTEAGDLYCWGSQANGRLGAGVASPTESAASPLAISF